MQFHPEVVHTAHGQDVLRRFVVDLAGAPTTWTMDSIIDQEIATVRAQVGSARVICGLSGGVDSSVAAALVHRAIGRQLTCVYVDTGLRRRGEGEQVVETFRRNLGIELIHVDAGARFFERLAGVTEPEGSLAAEVPSAFVAVAVNVYAWPFVSPSTRHVRSGIVIVHVAPSGEAVIS